MNKRLVLLLAGSVFLIGCQSAPDESFQLRTSPAIGALESGADGEATAAEIRRANEAALSDPEEEPIFRESYPD